MLTTFWRQTATGLRVLILFTIVCGIIYPALSYGVAHIPGLAGNADILLVAAAAAADDEAAALARQVGEFGIEHYGGAGSWPCGIAGGVNQSLMLGISGIGYFYLRLNDPGLASVLAI